MLNVHKTLGLSPVEFEDQEKLISLMKKIYPPVYSHFWWDGGERYISTQYSEEKLKDELANPNGRYYFVHFQEQTVGILRLILDEPLPGLKTGPMVKLHRIYLSPQTQGNGIGKHLLNWVWEQHCEARDFPLWLEVMDTQVPAIGFYQKMGFTKVNTLTFEDELMKKEMRGMYRMIRGGREKS